MMYLNQEFGKKTNGKIFRLYIIIHMYRSDNSNAFIIW